MDTRGLALLALPARTALGFGRSVVLVLSLAGHFVYSAQLKPLRSDLFHTGERTQYGAQDGGLLVRGWNPVALLILADECERSRVHFQAVLPEFEEPGGALEHTPEGLRVLIQTVRAAGGARLILARLCRFRRADVHH